MARPSVKAKRTEEILQAYERCIALYGVEGATLQKIAEEAGIARPLLRHHVGNSDDLLNNAVTRFIERSKIHIQSDFSSNCQGEDFIISLFHPTQSQDQYNDTMIAAAFIYASQTNSFIKKQMQQWLELFINSFSKYLQTLYPKTDGKRIDVASSGIIGIYFNIESLTPLGDNKLLRQQSCQAALQLLKTLNQ